MSSTDLPRVCVYLLTAFASACQGAGGTVNKADGPSLLAQAGSHVTETHSGAAAGDPNASADSTAPAPNFSTNFDLTESPISENGAWHHDGVDWTTVNTVNGLAVGTQSGGTGRYDDSYAYLAGFPPNQYASAVVHKDPALSGSTEHEVELLLRWSDSAHNAHGYECNLAFNGSYAEIVRWNGGYGDYTYVAPQGSGGPGAVHDGDVFSAQIVGNTITTFLNGKQLSQATDSKWSNGNPGIGIFRNGQAGAFVGDYGFTSFSAKGLAP